MTTATKAQALKALAKINATLDQDAADGDCFIIDAPDGFIFIENEEHSWTAGYYDRDDVKLNMPWKTLMPEIWGELVRVSTTGIIKCTGQCGSGSDCDIKVGA
jgi:hypothetical protein